jgi:hypothetical protein
VIILGLDFYPTGIIESKSLYPEVMVNGELTDVTFKVQSDYTVSTMEDNRYKVVIKDPKQRLGKGWRMVIEK